MDRITPCLWFDTNAVDAVMFYTTLFAKSSTGGIVKYGPGAPMPEGTICTINFTLCGQSFLALNGGPVFKFTPAISFFAWCDSREEIDHLWKELSYQGIVMMDIDTYPWSERYGWCQDRFGISWQLMLAPRKQKITPCLMFVGDKSGKAKEAINLYTTTFPKSNVNTLAVYEKDEGDTPGYIKHGSFSLEGYEFIAMDSSGPHHFGFSQATSFIINCDTQQEIDHYWDLLSKDGEVQQCGWLLDKYGVAWQIVPSIVPQLLHDPIRGPKAMAAVLKMVKLDIAQIEQATK